MSLQMGPPCTAPKHHANAAGNCGAKAAGNFGAANWGAKAAGNFGAARAHLQTYIRRCPHCAHPTAASVDHWSICVCGTHIGFKPMLLP